MNKYCPICYAPTKSEHSKYCEKHFKLNQRWGMPYQPLRIDHNQEALAARRIAEAVWRSLEADHQQAIKDTWSHWMSKDISRFKHQPLNLTAEGITRAGLWSNLIAKRMETADIDSVLERLAGLYHMVLEVPAVIKNKGSKVRQLYLANQIMESGTRVALMQKTKGYGSERYNYTIPKAERLAFGQWLEELADSVMTRAGIKNIKKVTETSNKQSEAAIKRHQQQERLPSRVYVWDNQAGFPSGIWYKTTKEGSWQPIPEDVLKGCQEGKIKYEWANRCGVLV